MTPTAQPIALPDVRTLLSGHYWNSTVGSPLSLTYGFLTVVPSDPYPAYPPYGYAETQGWAPMTAADEAIALSAMATISAIANVTFLPVLSPTSAQIEFGTDAMETLAGDTNELDKVTANQLVRDRIELANNEDFAPNEAAWVLLHELANSTGLQDFAVIIPADTVNNVAYSVMAYGNGMLAANFSPGGFLPVTPMIYDIAAWQYLYGVNQNGFTPSVAGTSESAIGNNHTYNFTDQTAPLTVWIGENVSGTNCFDFSACSTPVTIDLTPGTLSSSGQTASGFGYLGSSGPVAFANQPYQNVGIAYGTKIEIGLANAAPGSSLIADASLGSVNLLIGGINAADSFIAGDGFDIFVAAGGTDTAIFHDRYGDYKIISGPGGSVMVADQATASTDGTIVLIGDFTSLQFSDTTVTEQPTAPTSLTKGLAILDTAALLQADLDSIQGFVSGGFVSSITITDSGIPTLSITSAQASSDSAALTAITGNFSVSQKVSSGNQTISGVPNALGNTVVFRGNASQYIITPASDGVHFTVSTTGSSDQLSDIQALQFADYKEIVAPMPGSGVTVTGGNVTELYGAVLGRVPDVAGLNYYEKELTTNSALTLTTLAEDFLSAPEYAGNSAHNYAQTATGDALFIADCYTNLLNRAPETAAIPYYQDLISLFTKGLTPGTAAYAAAELQGHATVLVDFSASAEFLGDVQITATNPASVGFTGHWLVLI